MDQQNKQALVELCKIISYSADLWSYYHLHEIIEAFPNLTLYIGILIFIFLVLSPVIRLIYKAELRKG